ncbi:MAG TPA: hypothetical protein VF192_17750 [Longimicrobiales bacterium]
MRAPRPTSGQDGTSPTAHRTRIFCPDPSLAASLRAALAPAGAPAPTWTGYWSDLWRAAPDTGSLVVALPRLEDAAGEQIRRLRHRLPRCPIVLVTAAEPENVKRLRSVPADAVVWLDDLEELPRALHAARRACFLARAAARIEHAAPRLGPRLARALALALRAERPVTRVADLARRAGTDRRTLDRAWRGAVGAACPLRLEDVLDWILLFHAHGLLAAGHKSVAVAVQLGIHEDTVARRARALLGVTPRRLRAVPARTLERRFAREVLYPILSPPTSRSAAS